MVTARTEYGEVSGTFTDSIFVFRGIPYAKPPVDSLRFQQPHPPEPWDGILEGSAYGNVAPQPAGPSLLPRSNLPQSEDCLTLNIWTPGVDNRKRPVFVWVHGGGLTSGSGSDFYCNGHDFAKDGDVVFVSINYRLGALGFLYLGELLGPNYQSSGNNGLLDVIAALRWVQANISNFGGDASSVTVGGVSAGSKLVASLFSIPNATQLFQKVILQSGAAQTVRNQQTATAIAEEFLGHLQFAPEQADKLLSLPVKDILRAQQLLGSGAQGLHLFGPVRDGITLSENRLEGLTGGVNAKQDTTCQMPVLIGTTREEFKLYTSLNPALLHMDPLTLRRMFGRNAEVVSAAYRRRCEVQSTDEAAIQVMSDYVYSIASEHFADELAINGCAVWRYRFDWEGVYGATHVQDIPFVWNQSLAENGLFSIPDSARELASTMHAAWISFIRSGNPNTEGLPHWSPYDVLKRHVMTFNETCNLTSLSKLEVEPGFCEDVYVI